MNVLEERTIPDDLVSPTIELLESFELAVWVYRGADWLVRDPDGPHVAREAHTVQFDPTVVESFDGATEVAKIVGGQRRLRYGRDCSGSRARRVRRPCRRVALAAVLPRLSPILTPTRAASSPIWLSAMPFP
jgi:hypothetical protein